MRESVGSTWTFGLVITFIFLFSSFLVLTINYTKAYKVKNEVISIIEKYEGYTNENSVEIINNYLNASGYKEMGKCPISESEEYYGVNDLGSSTAQKAEKSQKYYYCVKQSVVKDGSISDYTLTYNIILFYKFNLPFLGAINTFKVNGESKKIVYSDTANYAIPVTLK